MLIDGKRQSRWSYWDNLGVIEYGMYGSNGAEYHGEVFVPHAPLIK